MAYRADVWPVARVFSLVQHQCVPACECLAASLELQPVVSCFSHTSVTVDEGRKAHNLEMDRNLWPAGETSKAVPAYTVSPITVLHCVTSYATIKPFTSSRPAGAYRLGIYDALSAGTAHVSGRRTAPRI
jgi:hypothetical protein